MVALALMIAFTAAAAPALPRADGADGRCLMLLGYVGAHGTPAQAAAARKMAPYFLGRLSARHPDAAIARIVTRAATEARTARFDAKAEGARCDAAYAASAAALTGGPRVRARPAPTPPKP